MFDLVEHDWGVALAESMAGSVLASIDDLDEAQRCQLRSLERAKRIGSDQQIAQALHQLAFIAWLDHRENEALGLLRDAAPIVIRHRYRTEASYGLDGLAVVALNRDDLETATRAVTVAEAVRRQLGIEPWPTLDHFIKRLQTRTRQRIGEKRYDQIAAGAQDADPFEVLEQILSTLE
jgi:hypothetical protein